MAFQGPSFHVVGLCGPAGRHRLKLTRGGAFGHCTTAVAVSLFAQDGEQGTWREDVGCPRRLYPLNTGTAQRTRAGSHPSPTGSPGTYGASGAMHEDGRFEVRTDLRGSAAVEFHTAAGQNVKRDQPSALKVAWLWASCCQHEALSHKLGGPRASVRVQPD